MSSESALSKSPLAQPKWHFQLLWQLALLALVAFIAYSVSNKFDQEMDRFLPESVMNCSTYNARPSGYRALFELAVKVGLPCKRFENSYRELAKYRGVLLIIGPDYPLAPYDSDRILAWVAKGNSLVYLDSCAFGTGKYLMDKIGIAASSSKSARDLKVTDLEELAEMAHVKELIISSEARLKGGSSVAKDSKGAFLVMQNFGKGRCLLATAPNLCANRRIAEKDNWGNFQFMINWLKSSAGEVLFDERVHGHSNATNVFRYLANGAVGNFCLQMTLLLLILFLSLNQRFGPAKSVPNKRKIASSEYIDGMALTYLKAKANDAAVSIIFGSFRNRLCKALSCSHEDSAEKIAASWSSATPLKYERLLEFLQKAESMQNSKNSTSEELILCMKECDKLYEASRPYLSVHAGRRLGG